MKDKSRTSPRHPILDDISDVLRQLEESRLRFDLADDDDLLDAIIYEQNALLARYHYLHKTARAQGIALGRADSLRADREGHACLTPSISEDS